MNELITQVFLFANGNVAAVDAAGKQVPAEQTPLAIVYVRDMLRRGVLDENAVIRTQFPIGGRTHLTIGQFRELTNATLPHAEVFVPEESPNPPVGRALRETETQSRPASLGIEPIRKRGRPRKKATERVT